jgi:hypothetical protein
MTYYSLNKPKKNMGGAGMKRWIGIVIATALLLGVTGFSNIPVVGPGPAFACGCALSGGTPGGGDYGPQSRGPSGSYFDRPALTEQQAHDVVEKAVKKWNPDLEVGKIKDGGSFFEAEVLTEEKEVFGRLAVDKQSGQIRVIY